MPVYTVHAPAASDARVAAPDRFTFVRDGFHFWALVFGFVWLLWNRLWLAALGWIVLTVIVDIGLSALGAGQAVLVANLLLALLLGFEGASLQRWTLSRGKWRQLDLIVADNAESAERRFFDRWTAQQNGLDSDSSSIDRGEPPPTRHVAGQSFSQAKSTASSSHDIIGLFPEPGASR